MDALRRPFVDVMRDVFAELLRHAKNRHVRTLLSQKGAKGIYIHTVGAYIG